MKSFALITTLALAAGVVAQSATTTITATPGCPSAAADVMVTRSNAPVPSCEAGNGTKPSVVTMSGGMGGGMGGGMNGSSTGTGMPSQFTGGAGRVVGGGMLGVVAGAAVYFL